MKLRKVKEQNKQVELLFCINRSISSCRVTVRYARYDMQGNGLPVPNGTGRLRVPYGTTEQSKDDRRDETPAKEPKGEVCSLPTDRYELPYKYE